MKVEDYLGLRAAFPDAELVDAQDAFERARARKSEEEIEGARESTRIAEACFDRLLELVRPGVDERALGAAMYERCYALGGEDPLFLSDVPGERADGGTVGGRFGIPADRVLGPATCSCSRSSWSAARLLDGARAHGRAGRARRADQCG